MRSDKFPGPWAVHPKLAQVDGPPIAEGGQLTPVCRLLWPTDSRSEEETFANAVLIAAAKRHAEAHEALRSAVREAGVEP